MKKFLALLMTVALFTGAFVGCTDKAATREETLIVGLDDSFPPMGFRDDNNEIVGFDVDLAKEAGKRMGYKEVKLQPIDWDSKELELQSGNIDVIWNGLTITDERKEKMLFTKPYLANSQVAVVKSDSDLKALADLKGKTVGVQKGSSAFEALEKSAVFSEIGKLTEFTDNTLALTDLANGGVDVVVLDEVVANYYITKNSAKFTILSEALAPEEYGVGIKMGNTELLSKLQEAIDNMIADGAAAEISEKWFGKDKVLK